MKIRSWNSRVWPTLWVLLVGVCWYARGTLAGGWLEVGAVFAALLLGYHWGVGNPHDIPRLGVLPVGQYEIEGRARGGKKELVLLLKRCDDPKHSVFCITLPVDSVCPSSEWFEVDRDRSIRWGVAAGDPTGHL
jgi:hypothetical protein